MKKLMIVTMAFMLGSFSIASAELGVNLGVSGQIGVFAAQGQEIEDATDQAKASALTAIGYSSLFLEKTLGSRLTIGVDYVPNALSSETSSDSRNDHKAALSANVQVTQKVQVDFEDLTTLYAALNITENFYVKAGSVSVDVITNEALGTGSTYANTSLDGSMLGAGYNYNTSKGIFIRAEALLMEFDGASLTSTAAAAARPGPGDASNVIKLNELDGVSAKISIGKSF
jgi:hypothetical protein